MRKVLELMKGLGFEEPGLRDDILAHGKVVKAGKGDVLIREGQRLDFLPIVIDGTIRVFRQKEDREVLLYYVKQHQTCVMSLSSAYFSKTSTAYGQAVEPTEILVIPTHFISAWQLKYPSWNEYVIRTFRSRYDELLDSFGSLVFDPIHSRLREYLTRRAKTDKSKRIQISHQTLAHELGTTRVVVSRILKQFEQTGGLKLHRGYIQLA